MSEKPLTNEELRKQIEAKLAQYGGCPAWSSGYRRQELSWVLALLPPEPIKEPVKAVCVTCEHCEAGNYVYDSVCGANMVHSHVWGRAIPSQCFRVNTDGTCKDFKPKE